jgi:hypothetical protein
MRRALLIAAIGAVVAMVAIHIPMLWRHRGAGTCPFGYGGASVATHHDPRLRGTAVAAARPALGLALDAATRGDVTRWALLHGSWCVDHHAMLECDHVAMPGGLALTAAWFGFTARGTLDSIQTVRRTDDARTVAAAFATATSAVTRLAGPATTHSGEVAELADGALRQAAAEYRFANYRAVVRATNLGDHFALTEEYANLVD